MKKKELKVRFHHDDKSYFREFWEIFPEGNQKQPCFIIRDTSGPGGSWRVQGLSSWEQDNWRDNNRQTVSREVLSCFDFCGDELQIIRKTERHTECSLTWRMYFADWADEDRSSSYVWFFGYEVGCDVIDTDNQETKKIH